MREENTSLQAEGPGMNTKWTQLLALCSPAFVIAVAEAIGRRVRKQFAGGQRASGATDYYP